MNVSQSSCVLIPSLPEGPHCCPYKTHRPICIPHTSFDQVHKCMLMLPYAWQISLSSLMLCSAMFLPDCLGVCVECLGLFWLLELLICLPNSLVGKRIIEAELPTVPWRCRPSCRIILQLSIAPIINPSFSFLFNVSRFTAISYIQLQLIDNMPQCLKKNSCPWSRRIIFKNPMINPRSACRSVRVFRKKGAWWFAVEF